MRFALAALLLAVPGHGAFLARDDAAVNNLFQPYPGLSPRYLLEGMPAVARRDSPGCNSGYHSCLDINSTLCCPNDRYCMIDPSTSEATCCSIGLTCNSPCNDTQYECNATTVKAVTQKQTELISGTATLTLTSPNTQTGAGITLKTITATITTTSVYLACCARHCPATSHFLCASTFGGGCCQYGQTCASSSNCIWTSAGPTASDTATGTGLISALPSSCTSGQISCASSLGGGCCATGHACTVVSDQVYCAEASGVTNSTTTDGGSGLAAGAKAGIALGVVFGAGAFIGAATWLCIRRRRQSSAGGSTRRPSALPPPSFATHEYDDLQQGARQDPRMYQESLAAGAVPGSETATSPDSRSWRHPSFFRRNAGINMPASSSPATPGITSASERGATQDYFGPVAVAGPFTADTPSAVSPHGGLGSGVPLQPQGPHHIVAPVEIDSSQRGMDVSVHDPNDEKYALGQSQQSHEPPPSELPQAQQHFELYGSEVPVVTPAETAAEQATPGTVVPPVETPPETGCDSPTVPRTPQPFNPGEAHPEPRDK